MSRRFVLNLSLLASAALSAGTGLLLQIKYHIGHPAPSISLETVWGHEYPFWSSVHKFASVVFLAFALIHLFRNHKWIKGVLTKRRMGRPRHTLMLSGIFLAATLTGSVAWSISGFPRTHVQEKLVIEIHDKITLFLVVFLFMHTWKRKSRI
jgi:hypothetical protein